MASSSRDPFRPRGANSTLALLSQLLPLLFRGAAANPRGVGCLLGLIALILLSPLGWYFVQPSARKAEMRAELAAYWQQEIPAAGNERRGPPRQAVLGSEVLNDFWTRYFHPGGSFVSTRAALDDNAAVFAGEPRRASFPYEIRTLRNTAYTVGYCEELADPVWSAYRVFRLPPGSVKIPHRPGSFFPDTRTNARVEPGDFTGSGYDRGHMTPNFAIGSRYSREAQEETFLLSNICPQRHRLNAGWWADLEARVADNYPARFGQVWVLAGPIFGPLDRVERLRGKIAVPSAFYMIIAQKHEGGVRVEAFAVSQDGPGGGAFDPYLTTVGEIERQTGLRFFPQIDDATHAQLAAQRPATSW